MPNDEAPNSLRIAIFFLGVIISIAAFLYVLYTITEADDYFYMIIGLGYDGPGLFFLLFFSLLGLWGALMITISILESILHPKTKSELKYHKKCKEIERKYHSEEIQKLKKKEAKAEWELEEARNALKELK